MTMEWNKDLGFEAAISRQLVLGEMLARNARKYPDQETIIIKGRRVRFKELDERVNRLANAMLAKGIQRGDKVGILMTNRIEVLEVVFAAAKIGAVSVPLNIRLSAPEIAYILTNSDAKILFFGDNFTGTITKFKGDVPLIKNFIVTGKADGDFLGYEDFLASGSTTAPQIMLSDDDDAFIVYTSGTTGKPKGARLSHKNIMIESLTTYMDSVLAVPRREGLPHIPSKSLSIAPLFHIGGLVTAIKTMVAVVPMVVMEFDPLPVLKAIDEEKITFIFLVPAMWKMVIEHPDFKKFDVSSLRVAANGAAPMSSDLKKHILEAFPNAGYQDAFGMTEMSATAIQLTQTYSDQKEGSVGIPFTNVEVRLVDHKMNDVSVNEVGEIVYRGPIMFNGYYKSPEGTREAFEGGWFHSGDMGRRDEDGFIYLVDRKKDMIITGGENVYSAEVETVLNTHPDIMETAVVGIPDPKWGETVKAFVVLAPGKLLTEQEVFEFCNERMARYKRPKQVEFLSALPRNAAGKVLKKELRGEKEASTDK